MNNSTIICGSKRYEKANFDNIVDSFKTIVRTNMLLPDSKYGKRIPTIQVVNNHVYKNFVTSPTKDLSLYTKEKKITKEHIDKFVDLLNILERKNIITFPDNNTHLFKKLVLENNINIKIKKETRCGLSYIPCCIEVGIRPFLIGFSLKDNDILKNVYTNSIPTDYHDIKIEIQIITKLHQLGLIDASFCSLKDKTEWDFDYEIIEPTKEAKKILNKLRK